MYKHESIRPMPTLIELSRHAVAGILERFCRSRVFDILCIDGTCGNGYDTAFMAKSLSHYALPEMSWKILSFDVQNAALEKTAIMLQELRLQEHVELICDGHEHLEQYIGMELGRENNNMQLVLAMYNLGFLPGSDKRVITRSETTLQSLASALERLAPGGLLAVHTYGGHAGGQDEMNAVEAWFQGLPFAKIAVSRYGFCNKERNPEMLYLAEKKMNRAERR